MSNLDLEFEIQHERERACKPVLGNEFDTVTDELARRLETLENQMKELQGIIEEFKKERP